MYKWFSYISKYRQVLMGIAILGVMIGHCKSDWPVTLFSKITGVLCYSLFTGGFLFLSGYGLYFSMSKNPDTREFYQKRMKRLIIPWLCIATPYFVYMDIVRNGDLSDFIWHLSTLSFWKSGNYSGMWYISVILVLYLIYPWFHKFIFRANTSQNLCLIVTVSAIAIVEYALCKLAPIYYHTIEIAMNVSIFFIGVHVGYLTANSNALRKSDFIGMGGGTFTQYAFICLYTFKTSYLHCI